MAETDSVAWTVENKETHEYYNEIPGKQPPPGGILDMRIQMESAVQKTQGNSQCADQLRRVCHYKVSFPPPSIPNIQG